MEVEVEGALRGDTPPAAVLEAAGAAAAAAATAQTPPTPAVYATNGLAEGDPRRTQPRPQGRKGRAHVRTLTVDRYSSWAASRLADRASSCRAC